MGFTVGSYKALKRGEKPPYCRFCVTKTRDLDPSSYFPNSFRRGFSETLTAPVRYGGVMRRYPPSLWDSVRAAIGCAAGLAVLLLVGVGLYLIAPYVFEWMGYVRCYVQQLLGGDCSPVLPTALQE